MCIATTGKVVYTLKTPYRDGTTQVALDRGGQPPVDFIARLAALVPRPCVNLTRYHGVLAPNHRWRACVTPAKRGDGVKSISNAEVRTPTGRHAAMTWVQPLKRVFSIDFVLVQQIIPAHTLYTGVMRKTDPTIGSMQLSRDRRLARQIHGLRLSLAGAQDKLPVVFDDGRIGLPRNGTPSSHILKPAIHAVEDSVINEGFCMALAEAMQLKPVKSKVHHVLDRSFLLVERYDRLIDAQWHRQRLHQEDFCQALGVVPEMKYQNEGGPDLAQCFDLVRSVTRPSAPQVLRLLDYVIFNALIGNHDVHAMNFSLLHLVKKSGKAPVLAPLYDTLSTAVYPTLTQNMAMKIGSKYKFSEAQARHWEQFAEGVGFTKAQAKRRTLELAKLLPATARKLQSDPGHRFAGNPVVEQINTLIEQRCALTIRRLTDPATENDAAAELSV